MGVPCGCNVTLVYRRVFLSDEKVLGCYHPLVAEDVVNLAEAVITLVRYQWISQAPQNKNAWEI